jgi:hypothetical protein
MTNSKNKLLSNNNTTTIHVLLLLLLLLPTSIFAATAKPTSKPSRGPSQHPTNWKNEVPTPPTFPTFLPTPSPSLAPSRPTVSKRPTYTTRSPTFTKVLAIECPVPVVKTLVASGNNTLMYWGADGSALRMESATITVMYHDGQRVMQKSSIDFGFEFGRERIVHQGQLDRLRLMSAKNTQKSTIAIGYMQNWNATLSVTYDAYNGWLNDTVEFIIDTSNGLDGFACTSSIQYFWCVATGMQLIDLPDFGNMEFRVFRKIAAPKPGKIVNGTLVDKEPTSWMVLPNFVTSELIWGNYDAVDAVTAPVIAFDGTQEVICVGEPAKYNDTVSDPDNPFLYDGCCHTKCYYNYNFPFNGEQLTRVIPMKNIPQDTTFIPNLIGFGSYLWGAAYNNYAPLYNYFPLTVNKQYHKWAGSTAIAGQPEYWLASNGRNGTFLIVFKQNNKLVSQVTRDLGDTPWSLPTTIHINATQYLQDPLKITNLKYDAFFGSFLLEMQNSKTIIQRVYEFNRGYWSNDTIILVKDRSVGRLGRVAFASGAFGDNYAVAYTTPQTGDLYVESCIPTNSPTQSPVPDTSFGISNQQISIWIHIVMIGIGVLGIGN